MVKKELVNLDFFSLLFSELLINYFFFQNFNYLSLFVTLFTVTLKIKEGIIFKIIERSEK